MDYWHDLSPGKEGEDILHVVVEIPQGSINKYEYDHKHKVFRLDRVLSSPMHYPGDYGFIPQTLGKDDDPLDALVMTSTATNTGILIEARPIGVLHIVDDGKEDDKILCVPVGDVRSDDLQNISDMKQALLDEIAHFFKTYKQLENKKVEVKGWSDLDTAKMVIQEAITRYKNAFKD